MAENKKMRTYNPDIAIPPGETLQETLSHIGMTQKGLAIRMNRPIKTINEIIKGTTAITPETAHQLAQVLDIPASFWINLEANYQITKAKLIYQKRLESQKQDLKSFPYLAMSNLGWVKKTKDPLKKIAELLSFFGVTSLKNIQRVEEVAYRKAKKANVSPEALSAWLRKGENDALTIEANGFDKISLKKTLSSIRALIIEDNPMKFEQLKSLCSACGVAVVYTQHLPKTFVNGAARWLTPRKALIQLSIRYKYEDVFWFSLFHEVGHILKHGKKEQFIDFRDSKHIDEEEKAADNFAKNILIPNDKYDDFKECPRNLNSGENIKTFASEIGIAPAIVVGRLQHDRLIPYNRFNHLRKKLDLSSEGALWTS